jgi:hypothetical protein
VSGGPGPNATKPKVVLLHGLLRGAGSMRSLARQVRLLTGCEVFSISYPSHQAVRSLSLAITNPHVEQLRGRARRVECGGDAMKTT